MRIGYLAYPWDLIHLDQNQFKQIFKEKSNCTALMVNSNYHHARCFRPLAEGGKMFELSEAFASFTPQPNLYEDPSMVPVPNPDIASTEVLSRMREYCQNARMDNGIWALGLHNSTLSQKNPDKCMVNCFGDIYPYALCPSNASAQSYITSLVEDLCQQFHPDRIMLEGIGFLSLRHGVHHELIMVAWDELLEVLFSLCFCESCKRNAEAQGIEVEELRIHVCTLINELINQERGNLPLGFRTNETAALLLEVEGLWEYIKTGQNAVTALVKNAHTMTGKFNTILEVIPASFHRPSSNAWLERASLNHLAKACDSLVTLPYFNSPEEVKAELDLVKMFAPESQITTILNAASPTPSAEILQAQAQAVKKVGCDGLYFYNYGMLTQRRHEWVSKTIESINH